MKKYLVPFFLCILLLASCNKDDLVTADSKQVPVIELDSENGIYSVKTGRELTISPSYKYADNALFAWTIDGKLVSTEPTLNYSWDNPGDVYVTLRVDNANGYAEEELKVEVLDLLPPAINLYIPAKGLKVQRDVEHILAPDIKNSELADFKIEWLRNGIVVSNENTYTFKEIQLGNYTVTIKASNEDGETIKDIVIEVVENMPYEVSFPKPYYTAVSNTRHTFASRPVFLRPLLDYFDNPTFEWSVDGKVINNAKDRVYKFIPQSAGEYLVKVTVTEEQNGISVESTVKVVCVQGSESSSFRNPTSSSSSYSNKVFEYLPAPGQFINETNTGGFTGDETTHEAAIRYATKRIENKNYVSLGSFGGYIIVGFDHSIPNTGGYDFAIQGNAFDSSNEPGIVWVMQDTNGNGLPDDEWYELKGSETGKETTIQDYEVTYFKPASKGSHTHWIDNVGNSGWIDFNAYHTQDFYYPLWMDKDSYTLIGTRLLSRNTQSSSTGYWSNNPFEWGYADNWGSDVLGGDSYDGSGQMNGFKISNAIYHDGTPANLKYIDFIKVQVGVLAKSGALGEISTEVFSFQDLNINK